MLRLPCRAFRSELAEHVKVTFLKSQTPRPFPLATTRVSTSKTVTIRRPMATTAAAAPAGLSAEPAQGQIIEHGGKRYTTIREGLAYILVPEAAGDEDKGNKNTNGAAASGESAPQTVFYNPIQQFNRDLSVLAIKAHGKVVMEKRLRAAQRRMEMFADKKRKRHEKREQREEGERPQKVAKTQTAAEGAAAPPEATEAHTTAVAEEAEAPFAGQEAQAESVAPVDDAEGKPAEPSAKHLNDKTPRLKILDALSATGLRALRYAHELPFPTMVTSNDLLAAAVDSIKVNVKHNRLEDSIHVNHGNAQGHMYTVLADELTKSMLAPAGNKHRRQTPQEQLNNLGGKYDVIDLDPYGTAATFFDSAVQAVRDDGGLLCVTCTDPGVWASNGYPEKAFALYGGIPTKGFHCHEAGLRLILHGLASSAARYGLAIEPLLSLSIDYYARVFVRVTKSPAAVKFQAGKTMVVYNCDVGCGAWETQLLLRNRPMPNKKGGGIFYKHGFALAPTADKVCEHCGTKTHLAGPMYAGRLHSPEFIQSILDDLPNASPEVYGTTDRIKGMLTTALEEIMDARPEDREAIPKKHVRHEQEVAAADKGQQDEHTNGDKSQESKKQAGAAVAAPKLSKEERLAEIEPYPFFWSPSMVAKVLHCQTPNEDAIKGALRGLGYRAARSHCKPGSVKTDAPWSVIWDVMREWVRQKAPIHEGSLKEGSPGWHIMHGLPPPSTAVTGDGGDKMEGVEEQQQQHGTAGEGQASKLEVVFDEKLGREKNKERLIRYPVHPENWGPRSRAVGE